VRILTRLLHPAAGLLRLDTAEIVAASLAQCTADLEDRLARQISAPEFFALLRL
jgi:hypothetical protein